MPEGPEIARAAGKIAKALEGVPLVHAYVESRPGLPDGAALVGLRVESVTARGKALLIRFCNGRSLYSHNQLYGVWKVVKAGSYPVTGRSLRVELRTERRSALLYSATDIAWLSDEELAVHPFLQRLGLDVLDEKNTEALVAERFLSRRFHKRSLGALLLDQHFLAGVGNYLRSEILHFASVRPEVRPCDCTEKEILALAHGALLLSRQSLQHSGVTNDLERAKTLKAAGAQRRHYRHLVFARPGLPCYRCGATVKKMQSAGRRLYLCPKCQKFSSD